MLFRSASNALQFTELQWDLAVFWQMSSALLRLASNCLDSFTIFVPNRTILFLYSALKCTIKNRIIDSFALICIVFAVLFFAQLRLATAGETFIRNRIILWQFAEATTNISADSFCVNLCRPSTCILLHIKAMLVQ